MCDSLALSRRFLQRNVMQNAVPVANAPAKVAPSVPVKAVDKVSSATLAEDPAPGPATTSAPAPASASVGAVLESSKVVAAAPASVSDAASAPSASQVEATATMSATLSNPNGIKTASAAVKQASVPSSSSATSSSSVNVGAAGAATAGAVFKPVATAATVNVASSIPSVAMTKRKPVVASVLEKSAAAAVSNFTDVRAAAGAGSSSSKGQPTKAHAKLPLLPGQESVNNDGWTQDEDEALRQAVLEHSVKKWDKVHAKFEKLTAAQGESYGEFHSLCGLPSRKIGCKCIRLTNGLHNTLFHRSRARQEREGVREQAAEAELGGAEG